MTKQQSLLLLGCCEFLSKMYLCYCELLSSYVSAVVQQISVTVLIKYLLLRGNIPSGIILGKIIALVAAVGFQC